MERPPTRHSARLAIKERLKAQEAENAPARVLSTTLTASSSSKGRRLCQSRKRKNDATAAHARTVRTRGGNVTKDTKTKSASPASETSTTAPEPPKAAKVSKKRRLPAAEDQSDCQEASPKKKRRSQKPKKGDASAEAQSMDIDPQQQPQGNEEEDACSRVPPRPINPTDPCERLPTELWHQVLAQLPLSQAATTSLVSKTWLDGALAWPKWRHLCEDLKLGSPKRKFRTYMSIVCLHSFFICDLCFSYSTGFRKSYGSQIPLPVDIVVRRLDWEKELASNVENAEEAGSAEPAQQKKTEDPSHNVPDAESAPSSQLPPSIPPQTEIAPPAVEHPETASSNQPPRSMPAPSNHPPAPVQQAQPVLSSPPPPAPAHQEPHLADDRHTQSGQVPTSQLQHVQSSEPGKIQTSEPEQVQASQQEQAQASQHVQVSQLHIPEGALDAGVAEQMKQAISQLIEAAKLSQELAAEFRAQVKTSTVSVSPEKNQKTAPQADATANKQTTVAKTQEAAAPAVPAKPPQPVERWNLCHPCRLQHYRTHPQPSRPVYDMYSGRVNEKRKKLARMCKTRALCRYGLSTADIRDLDYIERRNPHHRSWNPMMLYSIRDLQKRALAVHGGWVGVDAFKDGVNKKRRTAFNARMALWKGPSKSKKKNVEILPNTEEDDTNAVNESSSTVLA
ncbi:hypothetical protein EC968_001656 [Mortierella alpina]|nr:hypothetical protein EC968_001656 [Mortierella alpina]